MQGGASDSQLASMPISLRARTSCDAPFSASRAQESLFTLSSAGDSMCMDDDRGSSLGGCAFSYPASVTCASDRP
jgi:hypothetical protein